MIWEPFVLALVLGLIVSAGLYFAYLWPSVEPIDPVDGDEVVAAPRVAVAVGGGVAADEEPTPLPAPAPIIDDSDDDGGDARAPAADPAS